MCIEVEKKKERTRGRRYMRENIYVLLQDLSLWKPCIGANEEIQKSRSTDVCNINVYMFIPVV